MTQEALRMAHKALVGLSIKHGEMTDEGMDAIAAIKEALAQEKALQALHSENERLGLYKEAYAQPEQEPVAWTLLLTGEHNGLIGKVGEKFIGAPDYYQRVNVYTALPQRTWVGLAAEDRLTAKYMQDAPDGIEAVIDYIEAKLKERNT